MQTGVLEPSSAVAGFAPAVRRPAEKKEFHGDGRDILLQGFHWDAHEGWYDRHARNRKSWYRILQDNAGTIRSAGFTWVWFPPASESLAPQGYIPRRWYNLNTAFGSEAELRGAIQSLGPVKALADVILNHRVGAWTGGADFEDPPFPDNRAAITRDDESGIGTGNPDTGERYAAGRDLDHTNPDVRWTIKKYLHRLQEVGFQGWRYDLVKGFHGRYIREYNEATGPDFSVGEFYDGDRQKVTDWVDSTGGNSTAFDFPLRYRLYECFQDEDYSRLRSSNCGRQVPVGLIGIWPSRAVTFLDNHDTEFRRDEEHRRHHDGTRHFRGEMVSRGYAYLLTHPGIPCIFWSHFFDWGEATRHRIEKLMHLRKSVGIHAGSWVEIKEASRGLYAAIVEGKLAVKLGPRGWHPGGGWHMVVDGDKFAVWRRSH